MDSFAFFSPKIIGIIAIFKNRQVYVPARGVRRGVSRANLALVGGGWGGPERLWLRRSGGISLETSAVATGQAYVDGADWPLFA